MKAKKMIALLLSLVLAFSLAVPAFASDAPQVSEPFYQEETAEQPDEQTDAESEDPAESE